MVSTHEVRRLMALLVHCTASQARHSMCRGFCLRDGCSTIDSKSLQTAQEQSCSTSILTQICLDAKFTDTDALCVSGT